MVAFILPANSVSGYEISNSIRLIGDRKLTNNPNAGSGSDGSRTIFSISMWVKRGDLGLGSNSNQNVLISASASNNFYNSIKFNGDDRIQINLVNDGADKDEIITNASFRDTSAWYHLFFAFDKTQAAIANGVKIYVNGALQTLGTTTYAQNQGYHFSRPGKTTAIGVDQVDTSSFFNGYMTEIHFVDGTAKAHTDFGETNDDGVWIPKKYTGAYGTYGFFLEFKQVGTGEDASGMGADTSGNDEHFAVANLAAKDNTTDTCTNNFATLNPSAGNSQLLANGYFFGNTRVSSNVTGVDNSNYLMSISSIGVTTGKWYAEFKATGNLYSSGTDSTSLIGVGSGIYEAGDGNHNTAIGGFTHWWLDHDDDRVLIDGNTANNNMNDSTHVAQNDIIGVYLNCDTTMPTVTFQKNGAALGGATNSPYNVRRTGSYNLGTNNPIFFMPVVRYGDSSNNGQFECNFGNPPNLPSSGNTDANGHGNFEYSATLGGVNYFALCTKNLAEFG